MGKHKFVLTKHTKKNGKYYYTCMVVVERVRKPNSILELIKYGLKQGVPFYKEYYLSEAGNAHTFLCDFEERETALNAIDLYIYSKEKEDGENVASTETEIIYR